MHNIMVWKNRARLNLFCLLHGAAGLFRGGKRPCALTLLVLTGLMLLPLEAHADRTIDSATLNGASSVSVPINSTISAVVNVTTTNNPSDAKWKSTSWRIGGGAATCVVNSSSYNNSGSYSETFNITAPGSVGTYNVSFTAYNDTACSSGASATYTLTNAVTTTLNLVPTVSGISPSSKNLNSAAFTLTVNGSDFVNGAVVRFNGSDRTTAFVSSTQLTATIPATDLTAMGSYNITVFNPAPGGGTSNAQTFTVTPQPPTATTSTATGVTAWVGMLNGIVSSNGGATTVSFEYGLTNTYGNSITASPSTLDANAASTAVSAEVIGFNCNSTFHYRVVATNSGGTSYGLDHTLTTGACTPAFPADACPSTRYGNNLSCNANDVNLSGIALAPTNNISSCVSGTPVTLDLDLTVNFSSPDRWDVGIFIAKDGKLPTLLPTNGGAATCTVSVLPTTAPFLDLDGVPQGTGDTCGDGNSSINGGTGSGVKRMTGVTLPCYASPQSAGQLYVPFVVSWDNQKSPVGSLCTSNLYPVPNTSSKCNAPASSVSIPVVVLPVITKTNGVSTLNPGANTTYTVTITNNTGGVLLDSVFTDPAVADLTVHSVSCAAANGATCPPSSVTVMQSGGIPIPSANLPNNSSLTFTLAGTVSSSAVVGSHIINTATVNISGNKTSATDDDTVVITPTAVKSFSPASITTGSLSQLAITLSNPTASPVTGVSFTDTYPAGLVNASSANGTTNCGGTVTAFNNGNSLALSGGTIPAAGSCTVTVNVTSASVGGYVNSTGLVAISGGSIAASSATLTVATPVVGAFNACDVGTICTSTTTVTNSHITTKIAGTAFNLDLVELSAQGNYNKAVKVELLDSSDNSGALDANNCRSTWTVINTLAVNPTFTNSKVNAAGSFTVNEAYRDVRVRVTSTSGSAMTGCSTDNFAIRPSELVVSPTDIDWQTAGLTRALNNTSASTANPIHKTGSPFTVTATAKNSLGNPTANYTGIPTSVLGACSGTACPVLASLGTFTMGSYAAGSGILTWTANYNEVGAFDLTLQDTDFTLVDAADSVASCAGRYVCSVNTPVGRFVPDHFDVTGNNGTMAAACSNSFTYAGQPMYYGTVPTLTITPLNAATGGAVTKNYQGGLQKLTTSGISITAPTADSTQNGTLGTKTALSASIQPGTLSNSSGTMTYTLQGGSTGDKYIYARDANAQINSYISDIRLVVNTVTDSDNVSAGTGVLPKALNPTGVPVRYGRLNVASASGPETQALTMPITAEYWNGTSWVTNPNDSCTSFPASNIYMDNYGSKLMPNASVCKTYFSTTGNLANLTMSSGVLTPVLSLTAPGSGNTGSVDLTLNIGSVASGLTCTSAAETSATAGAGMPWFGANPKGTATFGSATGSNRFIYIRELYQ